MLTCHSHNLSSGRDGDERNFGLRLSLPAGDSFASVLGADWSTERWYRSDSEREAALLEITRKHPFSRIGDRPTYVVERISRAQTGAARDTG